MSTEAKVLRIVVEPIGTELYVATSPDMRGLLIHGRSVDGVLQRVPGIVRDLLELDGWAVVDVGFDEPQSDLSLIANLVAVTQVRAA